MASKIKLTNILVDLLCFLVVLVLFIASEVFIYGTDEGLYPFKRNFLCGDTSIQWPKKESTVPFTRHSKSNVRKSNSTELNRTQSVD